MSASTTLAQYYTDVLTEIGIDETSPIQAVFEALSNILGIILEQVKAFLDGTGLLILRLVNYAKQIIVEPKLPKKIRKAIRALQDIVESVAQVFAIPAQFGAMGQQIINAFTPALRFLGNTSINLYQLASDTLDATFFGDLVFKPIFSNIVLPTFDGFPTLSGGPSMLDIMNPFIQLITSIVLAPFSAIKAILEPFKPIWRFIQALASGSPMKLIRALGRLPGMLSKLVNFLMNLKNAFSSPFPNGLFAIVSPLLENLLIPVIAVSDGLQSLGVTRIVQTVFEMISNLFTNGPAGLVETLKALSATSSPALPSLGLVMPLYAFFRGSILGSVNYLFGPLLEIIGFSMQFPENNLFTLNQSGELTIPEFTAEEMSGLGFDDAWYQHQAWMNEFGQYANRERTDVLYPDREYDWPLIMSTNTTQYIDTEE